MNELVFTGSHKPLEERDIQEFEQWLEARLPWRYRSFLLAHNGGHPHKHLLPGCYLEGFNAITDASCSVSLKDDVEAWIDDFPDGFISIGYAGNGDRICLSLADEKIFLWEHERPYNAHPPHLNEFVLLANNIDDLLSKLEGDDPPVPDDDISNIGRWGDIKLLDDYLKQGHDINKISPTGKLIIRGAVYARNLDFVKACHVRGAILKDRGLLHGAAFTGEFEITQYLLEQGLDANEIDELGRTPLDCALYTKSVRVSELLMSKGGVRSKDI